MVLGAFLFLVLVLASAIAVIFATPRSCVLAVEPKVRLLEGDERERAFAPHEEDVRDLASELETLGFKSEGVFLVDPVPARTKGLRQHQARSCWLSADRKTEAEIVVIRSVSARGGEVGGTSLHLGVRSYE